LNQKLLQHDFTRGYKKKDESHDPRIIQAQNREDGIVEEAL